MLKVKYYDRINELQSINLESDNPPFDINKLQTKGFVAKLAAKASGNPLWLLKILRRICPVLRVGRYVLITRADYVQEVLTNTKAFSVPFGNEMRTVGGGNDFILGMNNGSVYRTQKSLILTAFPPDQMAEKIRSLTAKRASECIRTVSSNFNPISDLFSKSAVLLCEDYFGLCIGDKQRFYESSLAVSSLLFADPSGNKGVRELAMVGASHLLQTIDQSISKIQSSSEPADSPLARLVNAHQDNPETVPLDDVRAIMTGMILGFLPTTILAAGKALEVIFKKPQAHAAISDAIKNKDDNALELAITEAMRFNPIQIGPFRIAEQDYFIGAGTSHQKKVRKNSLVIASTFSAMFDPKRVNQPDKYKPGRDKQDSMIFGYGLHSCIGAPMARAFCTEVMKSLFSLPELKRARGAAGKMQKLGIFPHKIVLKWNQVERHGDQNQSMATICIPIKATGHLLNLQDSLASIGNVAPTSDDRKAVADILTSFGTIHFASGCVSDAFFEGEKEVEPAHLLFEVSGDIDERGLTKQLAQSLDSSIGAQIKSACGYESNDDLSNILLKHRLKNVNPMGKTLGLRFSGTPGHNVQRIKKEAQLSAKIYELIRQNKFSDSFNSLHRLNRIREHIAKSGDYDWAFTPVRNRISEPAKGLLKYIVDHRLAQFVGVTVIAFVILNFNILDGVQDNWWDNMWHLGAAISLTVIGAPLLIGPIVIAALLRIRVLEKEDPADFSVPDQQNYDAVTFNENQLQQNHMFAVSRIKKNFLRPLAIRAVLFWIKISAGYRNTPGIISVIDSIHFARWVRIPNTDQLVFFSNYGGSWESYLEDFISKASTGLTGVWSNTIGFPQTRYLHQLGAKKAEPFKYWARKQQRPTPFWYVAYPNITTSDIRKNSRIRQDFAKINDVRNAEHWFSLFGSSSRPNNGLDKANIQSLVFGGMGKRLPKSRLLFVSLNEHSDKTKTRSLMKYIVEKIHFGELATSTQTWQIAFTYRGLKRLGLSKNNPDENVFPNAFCQGMDNQARTRILGDFGDSHPDSWRWGSGDKTVDFVLMCYFNPQEEIDDCLKDLKKMISRADAKITFEQDCSVLRNKHEMPIEPFGFADGISQPIIKGTRKSHHSNQSDHLVAPGEILCGYPDERNNIAPSPAVEREKDILDILPEESSKPRPRTLKDFGYNGTYLVIRQLQQDVEAFENFCEDSAKKVHGRDDILEEEKEWVGAKMIGRWKNGQPLVSHPSKSTLAGKVENNFRYAEEDPQGLYCPLGAHTRRANPRDSLGEDHEKQIALVNRHRILRVGRPYENAETETKTKTKEVGLMFMCMNSDIERQFEFVQQSWLNNSNFHGLIDEKDTLVSERCPVANKFTIPTEQGVTTLEGIKPFVTTRGGSYFFMPGRQALNYLINL